MPRPTRAATPAKAPKKRDREVLDAAARVFYERGYSDASVQDVADELGILKGSLYHYIDTKEDLLFRLLQETHDEIYEILEEVAKLDGLNPLERLEIYIRKQVEYNIDNLLRVSVYYHDLERLTEERRKASGLADPGLDPKIAARCIFATIIWTYRWFRKGRDGREKVASTCAAFALRGVVGNANLPIDR
jgi:TetR/AcrR family transcriptional regulator, cholesterol catabolism regulator